MKMIGKTGQPFCGSKCCGERSKTHKRMLKRRERQTWKKECR